MRRLLLTASISALLLQAFGQQGHAASAFDSSPALPALGTGNAPIENSSAQTVAFNASPNTRNAYDTRPILVIQHDMPANIDLKARPRIASDLAVALREPAFTVFAAAVTLLLGMALTVLRRNLR